MISGATITGLRCEHLLNPIGIDSSQPRLSWYVETTEDSFWQEAYQIQVASDADLIRSGEPDLWDSGKVRARNSVLIAYQGKILYSGQRVFWRVRIWNENDQVQKWSKIARWEMGLLEGEDWKAKWIGWKNPEPQTSQACPFLRKAFVLGKPVRRARLYITSRGVYEAYLNGDRVGDDVFAPGWTEYDHRLEYSVYDVSEQLNLGENVVGAILGDGWYCGYLLWQKQRAHYGNEASLLAQIRVDYEDGEVEWVVTDESWKLGFGPLLESDFYNGERYDARRELGPWSEADYQDSDWEPATLLDTYAGKIVSKMSLPVRVANELVPKSVKEIKPGIWILDMGQNMVGQYRLHLFGAGAGREIILRFGEALQADGSLYTTNLRDARATDYYICRGGPQEIYLPRFTFHGFRYVEVTGYPGTLQKDAFCGLVLHSQLETTGSFECSDPWVNQLQSNIVWGQKGNFLDVPTDCPQRDERLGWTGDAQVFIPTACFNFNVSAFFNRWCVDMELAQLENGAVTDVVPSVLTTTPQMSSREKEEVRQRQGNAAWGDACVICPWVIYQRYGDRDILERSWEMMTRWMAFQEDTSRNLIRPKTSYGDWLAVDAVTPDRAPTPCDLIGTAYFAYTADLMARIAKVLGKEKSISTYENLHQEVLASFNREYVTESGRLAGDTQTAYLLALGFNLIPEKKVPRVVKRLVELIEETDYHLSTGFVGTPLLCPVLSRYGRADLAYKLLLQKTYPGWLCPVLNGATTMWERWNSWTEEGGFAPVSMNSFNHYAYGAIGHWLYSTVAGIDTDPDYPGFKKMIIRPQPGDGLTYAKAELKTPYGWVKSHWWIEDGVFILDVTVPANTSASVTLPSPHFYDGLVNEEPLEETHHVIHMKIQSDSVGFTLRSGQFQISIPLNENS